MRLLLSPCLIPLLLSPRTYLSSDQDQEDVLPNQWVSELSSITVSGLGFRAKGSVCMAGSLRGFRKQKGLRAAGLQGS